LSQAEVHSEAVFTRLGLKATGFWRSVAVPPRNDGTPPGEKLRRAFEELGGLYGTFAQFLIWRADLLGSDYIASLRQVRVPNAGVPRDRFIEILRRELPGSGPELVANLEKHAVWTTFSRTAYRTRYGGQTVVVQVASAPVPDKDFIAFESGIRSLGHPDVTRVTSPDVLKEFRQWIRQGESTERERNYLRVLAGSKADMLVDYPEPISDITTDHVLSWRWVEGESAAALVAGGSLETVTKIATAVLEQYCSLSIVDAELELDAVVVSPAGRLVMRRLNRPLAVPPPLVNVGIKYLSAVLAGDATMTVQTLLQMAGGQKVASLEPLLLNRMSGIEPELKVQLRFPVSAAAFESNWRALATIPVVRPLYLNCLHRNLMAIGYWNAEARLKSRGNGGAEVDAIAAAQWPVVGSLLRTQFSALLNPTAAKEWLAGAGLLAFGSMREMNRIAEELRDNHLTVGVESSGADPDPKPSNNALKLSVVAGLLVMTLLACLHWGTGLPGAATTLVQILAVCSVIGLFRVVSKIG